VYGADVLMSSIGVGDPAELWRQEAHRDSADSTTAALHQVTGSCFAVMWGGGMGRDHRVPTPPPFLYA
jgi:hypothetical protein